MMGIKLFDDIKQTILEEYIATNDFICNGQIIRSGSIYWVEKEYPPSHHSRRDEDV